MIFTCLIFFFLGSIPYGLRFFSVLSVALLLNLCVLRVSILLPVKVLTDFFAPPAGFIGFQTFGGEIVEVSARGYGLSLNTRFHFAVCVHPPSCTGRFDVLIWLVFFYRTFPSAYVPCFEEIVCVKHVLHSYKMFRISDCLVSSPLIGLSLYGSFQERVSIYPLIKCTLFS